LWFTKSVYLYFVPNRTCSKPLKPEVTVQIASDTGQSKDAVQPIPILGAMKLGSSILIAHGSPVFLSFETIVSINVVLLYYFHLCNGNTFSFKYVTLDRINF
jgi:hypothetical protein